MQLRKESLKNSWAVSLIAMNFFALFLHFAVPIQNTHHLDDSHSKFEISYAKKIF